MGISCSTDQTEQEIEQYIQTLYLTDLANMLLALHCSTNWLLFYHWPRFHKVVFFFAFELLQETPISALHADHDDVGYGTDRREDGRSVADSIFA